MKVKDVEAFHISGKGNYFVRDKYKDNVEWPGLEACLYLYDLNIRTTWFNCNKEDPKVNLQFSYDSLSDENKEIADSLMDSNVLVMSKHSGVNDCLIEFDATLEDDVDTISNRLLDIAKNFQYQDVLYGFIHTDIATWFESQHIGDFNAFVKKYGMEEVFKTVEELGLYYDNENETLWANKELYQKHMQYLSDKKGKKI